MMIARIFRLLSIGPKPDIQQLKDTRDIRGLMRLLTHPDPNIQWKAAETLGTMGESALEELLLGLSHRDRRMQLGIIEALGAIGDPGAVPSLLDILSNDESSEIRWATALALGKLGDKSAIPPLIDALRDPDKYVRFGASVALKGLGWEPAGDEEKAMYLIAHQDWPDLLALGSIAGKSLLRVVQDRDRGIRAQAVRLIGETGLTETGGVCNSVLKDQDDEVRWQATLAFPRCGIPLIQLPMGISRRSKTRQSPGVAAFLNFFFLGIGYDYLGVWWGIVLFQVNMLAIVLVALIIGPLIPYLVSYACAIVFAVHAWRIAIEKEERME